MSSFSVVIDLDILKNRAFCLVSAGKDFLVTAFCLECCPETLDHRIIVTITFFAHTSHNSMLLEQQLIADARIFTSAIGVMHQTSCWSPLIQHHAKCRFYQFCIVLIAHGPSHNFS